MPHHAVTFSEKSRFSAEICYLLLSPVLVYHTSSKRDVAGSNPAGVATPSVQPSISPSCGSLRLLEITALTG
jgi:hypothetical protein